MDQKTQEEKINKLATTKTFDELEKLAGELHSTSILYATSPDIYVQACIGYGMVQSAIKLKKNMESSMTS